MAMRWRRDGDAITSSLQARAERTWTAIEQSLAVVDSSRRMVVRQAGAADERQGEEPDKAAVSRNANGLRRAATGCQRAANGCEWL